MLFLLSSIYVNFAFIGRYIVAMAGTSPTFPPTRNITTNHALSCARYCMSDPSCWAFSLFSNEPGAMETLCMLYESATMIRDFIDATGIDTYFVMI